MGEKVHHFAIKSTPTGASSPPARRTARRRTALAASVAALTLAAGVAVALLGQGVAGATSHSGPCPNQELRQAKGSHLPHCMAYEQVSPVDKDGHDVFVQIDGGAISLEAGGHPLALGATQADGSGVVFSSFGSFAGRASRGLNAGPYLSRGTGDGWVTNSLETQRSDPYTRNALLAALTPDLSKSLRRGRVALDGLGQPDLLNNFLQDSATGELQLLVGDPSQLGVNQFAAPANLNGVSITTSTQLTPDAPSGSSRKLYHATVDGVGLESREPGSDQPFAGTVEIGGGGGGLPLRTTEGAVSDAGEHIFFTAGQGNNAAIYRRTVGVETELASPSKRDPVDPDGAKPKRYAVATPDGSQVFFASPERLTDDANAPQGTGGNAPGDLYRYDVDADQLVNLTTGTAGDDPAAVRGVLGVSNDGARAYFVATGQVVPGEGTEGDNNIYLWEEDGTPGGDVRYIATVGSSSDEQNNWDFGSSRLSRVTEDGSHLVFQTEVGHAGESHPGTRQIYLYDADADGAADELICVSCPGPGPGAATGRSLLTHASARTSGNQIYPRGVTEDGQRVFFSTEQALVPRDTNGRWDAYMWEDGEVHLISTGQSDEDSIIFGASADGDEAFFTTRERLVAQDGDDNVDLYVAKVNGGLAGQHATAPLACEGEECQGQPSTAPEASPPASAGFEGQGNVRPGADLRRCNQLRNRAQRQTKRTQKLRQRARKLRQRSKRHARRGNAQRAKRLRNRSQRVQRRAKSTRQRAQNLRQRGRNCRQEASR